MPFVFRLPRVLGVLAAGAALVVVPAQAAGAAAHDAAVPSVLGACAELTEQGPGWASLRNDCGVEISGSVQLSSGKNPNCVSIPAYGTGTVYWKGSGTAEYAFDCLG
ncbi:hypothetical protein ACH4RA_06290 [Streptomyces smyrnaeus]|uniref:hypothetical protein n=1 Tax=Streptomyces TaxID=1883 RepID=UPI000C18A6C2|nr:MULTISPECIES: hypothetical protein [unclassified Streptomyces]MBQ0865126.1 hypothetical protein [Streptomyces sp. RK75]MBQ1119653.1 hypothetical protein [Streptomyces sp. B15]MBQ1158699.1 hypothetical protein [Streptomyces sp. A73]